jgi:NOL1/NOP2/fmu family ribosome biogenesis protein
LLTDDHKWAFQEGKEGWNAFNANLLSELYFLQQKLNIVDYGIRLGRFMKENLIPDHGLAMSCDLNKQAYSRVDLAKHEALRFLKGEVLIPPVPCEKGYAIITSQDVPLGFAKNIGTRMNNLYPTNWRIRMSLT